MYIFIVVIIIPNTTITIIMITIITIINTQKNHVNLNFLPYIHPLLYYPSSAISPLQQ